MCACVYIAHLCFVEVFISVIVTPHRALTYENKDTILPALGRGQACSVAGGHSWHASAVTSHLPCGAFITTNPSVMTKTKSGLPALHSPSTYTTPAISVCVAGPIAPMPRRMGILRAHRLRAPSRVSLQTFASIFGYQELIECCLEQQAGIQ